MSQTIAKAVAALANTYGGLVLVGVTDDRQIVGVKEKTIEQVSQHCHSNLEPPWVPDVIPVPMDDNSGKYILVLRIVPGMAPRPLLVDGAAPIRNHNTTHPASWQQLAALFNEGDAITQADPWVIRKPELPYDRSHNKDKRVDLMIRSGLNIAIAPRASWRPLREHSIDQLADSLNDTSLPGVLASIGPLGNNCIIQKFHRRGHNRSRTIRLQSYCLPVDQGSFRTAFAEAELHAEVPGGYGQTATHLLVHLDVTLRLTEWPPDTDEPRPLPLPPTPPPAGYWKITTESLKGLLDAIIISLVDNQVVRALAELAQIDSLAVPQPRVMHMVTHRQVPEVLDTSGLTIIPDAGDSHGAHMLADPALDLADHHDRREQINNWLIQMALDAGLIGMEARLGPS